MKKDIGIILLVGASLLFAVGYYVFGSGLGTTGENVSPGQASGVRLMQQKSDEENTPMTNEKENNTQAMPPLSPEEKRIIIDKGTEMPFTGKYWNFFDDGEYVCRQCGAKLYTSGSKFRSSCGWPSFDDEIPGAIKRQTDADGRRTEILCAKCGAHLGHVFAGERLTAKNVRHCVNSTSVVFRAAGPTASEAYFAGGCFWGVEHFFQQQPGVIDVTSGYMGGETKNPTYREVCTGATGHAETVRVKYDPNKISYEKLARLFFEIHDPTEWNRQGPDVGTQYRSAIFYGSEDEKKIVKKLIAKLKAKGYEVVTEVANAGDFYPAEDYHQDYLEKHPDRSDCHLPIKRFEVKAR